ncbi:hypothetical protein [Saccharolobus islandicus]|uniref:hypothetical protein n=1 Tax=Saccharolobus islandicus TaxID=43080 RepID=UPI001ED94D58|nr:hypothetical protein [Sulfolobus islandicus]
MRTDKYYSKSTLDDFLDSEVYLIPRSNATIKGGKRLREMILRFMKNPLEYLEEYFKREKAESLISSIKRRTR